MTKKERIRLLIGIGVMVVIFVAIASIGWTQDECLITYHYGFDGKYETQTVKKDIKKSRSNPGGTVTFLTVGIIPINKETRFCSISNPSALRVILI